VDAGLGLVAGFIRVARDVSACFVFDAVWSPVVCALPFGGFSSSCFSSLVCFNSCTCARLASETEDTDSVESVCLEWISGVDEERATSAAESGSVSVVER